MAQLLIQLQTENPGVSIVSIGDYNAFEFSDGYVDLLGIIQGDQAPAEQVVEWSAMGLDPDFTSAAPAGDYSYSFDGNAQTLDHVLLSSAASAALTGFGHAHIDADFRSCCEATRRGQSGCRTTIRLLRGLRSRRRPARSSASDRSPIPHA